LATGYTAPLGVIEGLEDAGLEVGGDDDPLGVVHEVKSERRTAAPSSRRTRAMKIAMDAVGRLVVPKPLRDELGIHGPTELEVVARDGIIEISPADIPARVDDRGGTPVIVADQPVPPLTVDDVRAAVDRVRR
jgi:AbrB family looped-hinge helix DNA binding protein